MGTSRTTFVESDQSDFDENTSEKTFEIFVPPDASTLRVALNGEDDGDGSNDFDLFVLFGEPGTGGKPNCADAKPGQFAFCEFADPPTGEWHIRVKRERGKGKFQVVVTMFD